MPATPSCRKMCYIYCNDTSRPSCFACTRWTMTLPRSEPFHIRQIHAFGEGNTRTTAVFAIDNDLFEKHSWYFTATDQYLVRFFRNLILGEESTLSNREMHVSVQSITQDVSKSQFDTLNCSLEELAILKAVGENPHITQEALKKTIGKSISTVKRLTVSLQKKGLLVRKNGKRDGYWEVLTVVKN